MNIRESRSYGNNDRPEPIAQGLHARLVIGALDMTDTVICLEKDIVEEKLRADVGENMVILLTHQVDYLDNTRPLQASATYHLDPLDPEFNRVSYSIVSKCEGFRVTSECPRLATVKCTETDEIIDTFDPVNPNGTPQRYVELTKYMQKLRSRESAATTAELAFYPMTEEDAFVIIDMLKGLPAAEKEPTQVHSDSKSPFSRGRKRLFWK